MHVNIMGLQVPVKRDNEHLETLGSMGCYIYDTNTIKLMESYDSTEDLVGTLVHEMGHALLDRLGLIMGAQLEEVLVESFANMMIDNFHVSLLPKDSEDS